MPLSAITWTTLGEIVGSTEPDEPGFRFLPQRKGGLLGASQAHRIVKAPAKRAKLSAEVLAHRQHHACISHSLDCGAPIHASRVTASCYLLSSASRV